MIDPYRPPATPLALAEPPIRVGFRLGVAGLLAALSMAVSAYSGVVARNRIARGGGAEDLEGMILVFVCAPMALVQLLLMLMVLGCVGRRARRSWRTPGPWLIGLATLCPVVTVVAILIAFTLV